MKSAIAPLLFSFAGVLQAGEVRSLSDGALLTETECPAFEVSGVSSGVSWSIKDWRGEVRLSGVCTNGSLVFEKPLPPGYWTLAVDGAGACTFTVVTDPSKRRKVSQSPIGVDAGFSWCASPGHFRPSPFDTNAFENVARLIRLAGITEVRDRMGWGGVQSRRGMKPVWGRYAQTAAILRKNGLRASGVFHDSPDWTGSRKGGLLVPTDLKAVYDFCRALATDFADTMDVWEFWNEQDNTLSHSPVWEFCAVQKAALLGFHSAGPQVIAANGATCRGIDFGYDTAMFENDLARYADVFNTHVYSSLAHYPVWFGFVRGFLGRYGVRNMPILISECNMDDEGPATVPTDLPGVFAHTPAQELQVADFAAKSQILRLAGGVWRTHFFLFGARTERGGKKDWGLLRRDGTAKPGVAAYSALTEALEGLRPLGRADVGQDAVGYLFEGTDGKKTLAYWEHRETAADTAVRGWIYEIPEAQKTLRYWQAQGKRVLLVKSVRPVRLRDWCGTPRKAVRNGEILSMPIEKSVSYVTGDFDFPILEPATPIPTPKRYVPAGDEDLTVVVSPVLSTNDVTIVEGKSMAEVSGKSSVEVSLSVWNFSSEEKRGVLRSENGTLAGVPTEIVLPPFGKWEGRATVAFRFSEAGETKWKLSGVFNGKRTSRAVVRVRDPAAILAGCETHELNWRQDAAWTVRDSGRPHGMKMEPGAVRFDTQWSNAKTDRWFFPMLALDADEGRGARFLEFEVRNRQDKVENDFASSYVFFSYSDGNTKRLKYSGPTDQWEKVRVQLPSDPDPANLRSVQIGGLPKGMQLSFWLRNVRLLRIRQKEEE